MKFGARDIPDHAEPVDKEQLQVGSIYYSVTFFDAAMKVPEITTFVYVGAESENDDFVCFQDVDSYQQGSRLGDTSSKMTIHKCATDELKNVFDFDHMLEVLMRCSLHG